MVHIELERGCRMHLCQFGRLLVLSRLSFHNVHLFCYVGWCGVCRRYSPTRPSHRMCGLPRPGSRVFFLLPSWLHCFWKCFKFPQPLHFLPHAGHCSLFSGCLKPQNLHCPMSLVWVSSLLFSEGFLPEVRNCLVSIRLTISVRYARPCVTAFSAALHSVRASIRGLSQS